jgi:hypothetical protein
MAQQRSMNRNAAFIRCSIQKSADATIPTSAKPDLQ